MYTIYEKYEALSDFLGQCMDERLPVPEYRQICRILHVSPSSLDEILMEEICMSGDELVRQFR